tara:strand:+ start:41 stop:313 length:273 start_codon:yes stop_codon:yes gene_type:complete
MSLFTCTAAGAGGSARRASAALKCTDDNNTNNNDDNNNDDTADDSADTDDRAQVALLRTIALLIYPHSGISKDVNEERGKKQFVAIIHVV